jgi:uncharacterized iron-regulated membrane protein
MRYFRSAHRLVTVVIAVVTLYLAATGTMIQLIDLRSILTKAPASDPNVMAMREAFDGGGGYAVRAVKDYTAPALPVNADFAGMLSRTMESARLTVENTPLRYVELRVADNKPVGIVESAGRLAEFDAATGQIIMTGPSARTDSDSPDSERNTWKHLHRMTTFGQNALYINVVVGVGLSIMIATGLIIYFKMLSGRSRSTASSPFWSGGGWWRTWHRRISIVAALFLIVVSLSGLWLAYESLVFGSYMGSAKQRTEAQAFAAAQRQRNGAPPAPRPDPMSPEAEPGRLAAMQHDIGLTEDEMVKVKAVTDASVNQYLDLHKPGVDPQEARAKTIASHQTEANAIMAVLTDEEKPKFQAWRDAQLMGTPLPARGQRGGGPQGQAGQQRQGGPQGQSGPNAPNRPAGGPGGAGGPGPNAGGGGGAGNDPSSPLKDAELQNMLKVTLDAERAGAGDVPIKVVRLRYYAGMPQGVLVTAGDDNKQMVFNAQTGRAVSETEPGYPPVGFPFGWQAHQLAKDVHRGGIIGLPGRFMDLFAGLAMFYLSASGIWIYVDLWKRRRKAGKSSPVWV